MGKVENIESQIQELSPEELVTLRVWFAKYDAEVWDRQFDTDVKAGKLGALGERALRDHLAGRHTYNPDNTPSTVLSFPTEKSPVSSD